MDTSSPSDAAERIAPTAGSLQSPLLSMSMLCCGCMYGKKSNKVGRHHSHGGQTQHSAHVEGGVGVIHESLACLSTLLWTTSWPRARLRVRASAFLVAA